MIEIEEPIDNIVGVSPIVAKKIESMLHKGRRYFGSAGASLTWQVYDPKFKNMGIKPELAKVGMEGERDTSEMLKEWIKDKPNAVLVDSVHVRGWGKEKLDEESGYIDSGDTDHVLIIGSEVILIDTKRWKSKRNYSVSDNHHVLRSNKEFPGGKVHMNKAIMMWLDYLYDDAMLTGIIMINAEDVKVFRNRNWFTNSQYRLVEKSRFIELLDEKWNKYISYYDKNHINTTLVSQVVVSAIKPYDNYRRVFNQKALSDFR